MRNVVLIGAMLVMAAPMQAQTCVGAPMKPGSLAIGAGIAFPESAKSYHASLNGNTTGKLFWNATGGITHLDDLDTNQKDVSGFIGVKAMKTPVTICPRIAAGYSWWSDAATGASIDIKTTYGRFGAGVGYEIPNNSNVTVGLFATPSLVVQRTSASIAGTGYADGTDSNTDTAFGSDLGVTVGVRRVYLTGYTFVTSMKDTKATFGVNVGIVVH